MRPEPIHFLILIVIIVIIFGAAKLPSVAKNLGRSMKVFKSEVKDMRSDDKPADQKPAEISDASAGRDPRQPRGTYGPGNYGPGNYGPDYSADASQNRSQSVQNDPQANQTNYGSAPGSATGTTNHPNS